ncbi:hypothetical protein [Autumnicola psychrophila]|uniref:Lipocalin-like domain-containing protein n=1 Tax=Autumnicola psychrophila TaxID=3075592 RepID=A0ABU3DVS4_9FLAO|nr:hypothetical protein [Zunongwangia sp. F225]MDT0687817.1 hypothetical protein [Zunongwangia sp. F225]
MKKISLLVVVTATILFSCDEKQKEIDKADVFATDAQKWELVKMTGSFAGSETIGDEMEWQEYYLFNANGTFTKHRERNNKIVEASGSFETDTNEDGLVYNLSYSEENELIGNCHGAPTEYLYFSSDGETLLSSWWACDGPGLFYEQVK